MSPLTDPLGPDLKATLRALKLGKLTATLPERLTLAPGGTGTARGTARLT